MKRTLAFAGDLLRTRRGIGLALLCLFTSALSICVILLQPALISAFLRGLGHRQEVVTYLVVTLLAAPLAIHASACANNALLQHIRGASKERLFDFIIRKPLSFFQKRNEGWIESSISIGSHSTRTLVHETIAILSRLIFLIGAAALLTFWVGPVFGASFLGVLLLYLWLSFRLFGRNANRVQQAVQQTSVVSAQIADAIANVATIQQCNSFDHERKRLDEFLAREKSTYSASQRAVDRADAVQRLALATALAVFLIVAHSTVPGSDGSFVAIFIIMLLSYAQLESTGRALNSLFEHQHHLTAILEAIDYRPGSRPQPSRIIQASSDVASGTRPLPPLIRIEDAGFAYQPAHRVLDAISLKIEPGSHQLIQGTSGSGKTTLLKLLTGQLKPCAGRVLLEGRDAWSLTPQDKAASLCAISQRPSLFDRSLFENVVYGHSTSDQRLVIELLRELGLKTPPSQSDKEWLAMTLGKNGGRLSGGERQRVLIARAVLAARPVLVLDEATSELDPETEKKVLEVIHGRLAGCTIIAVSHHPHAELRGYATFRLPERCLDQESPST